MLNIVYMEKILQHATIENTVFYSKISYQNTIIFEIVFYRLDIFAALFFL